MSRKKKPICTPVYYTTFQVGKFLSVSVPTVVNWVKSGLIEAHRTPGGHRRIAHNDVIAFARKNNYPLPPGLVRGDEELCRVLIVDDDEDFAELLKDFFLPRKEFTVELANSGFEAGFKVRNFSPHVILMDICMPGMDGFEVERMLREDASTKHIPIVACTAFRDAQMDRRLANTTFADILEKPVDFDELLEAVRSQGGHRRS